MNPVSHRLFQLFCEKSRLPALNFCPPLGRFGFVLKSSEPIRHFGRSWGPPYGFYSGPKPLFPSSGSHGSLYFGPLRGWIVLILRTPCGRSPLRSDLTPKHILILTVETNEAVPVDGAIRFARITPQTGYLRRNPRKCIFLDLDWIQARIPYLYIYIKDDSVTLRVYI